MSAEPQAVRGGSSVTSSHAEIGTVSPGDHGNCEDDGMDTSTIDQAYQQLQTEFQDVAIGGRHAVSARI